LRHFQVIQHLIFGLDSAPNRNVSSFWVSGGVCQIWWRSVENCDG